MAFSGAFVSLTVCLRKALCNGMIVILMNSKLILYVMSVDHIFTKGNAN